MKIAATLLALAALAGAAKDSAALARFREDSTLAVGLLKEADRADSTAFLRRVQARTIFEVAQRHLAQDTARK